MTRRQVLETAGATLNEAVTIFMEEEHEDTGIVAFSTWLTEEMDRDVHVKFIMLMISRELFT